MNLCSNKVPASSNDCGTANINQVEKVFLRKNNDQFEASYSDRGPWMPCTYDEKNKTVTFVDNRGTK